MWCHFVKQSIIKCSSVIMFLNKYNTHAAYTLIMIIACWRQHSRLLFCDSENYVVDGKEQVEKRKANEK